MELINTEKLREETARLLKKIEDPYSRIFNIDTTMSVASATASLYIADNIAKTNEILERLARIIEDSLCAEITSRDERIVELEDKVAGLQTEKIAAQEVLLEAGGTVGRLMDQIARLKAAGQRMYESTSDPEERATVEFEEWRKLMEEVEGKCQKT